MDNIEIIDRGYAKIYVDETTKISNFKEYISNLMTENYYSNPGSVQWNYYWININNSVLDDKIKEIENDIGYCRKYVVRTRKECEKILERFPEYSTSGTVTIYKSNRIGEKLSESYKEYLSSNLKNTIYYPTDFLNNLSTLDMLEMYDILRMRVLSGTNLILSIHNDDELHLIGKKFNFLKEKYIIK